MLLANSSSLQIFIELYLKTWSNFIISSKIKCEHLSLKIVDLSTQQSFNMYTIASVAKKVGSHGDYRGVLLDCQDEKIGYHASKYLSKPSK